MPIDYIFFIKKMFSGCIWEKVAENILLEWERQVGVARLNMICWARKNNQTDGTQAECKLKGWNSKNEFITWP